MGQSDMEAGRVREKIGEHMLLGVSAQTVEAALAAQEAGADYLGVGAVFPTTTKADATEVTHDCLKAICEAVKIPVTAIGGISEHNMLKLADTGVDGVALVSAIFAADEIEAACRKLRRLAEEMVGA